MARPKKQIIEQEPAQENAVVWIMWHPEKNQSADTTTPEAWEKEGYTRAGKR